MEACERCGTFAALQDIAGRRMCEPCIARRALPLDDDPPTTAAFLTGTLRLLWHLGWRVPVAVMLLQVPFALLHLFVLPEGIPDVAYNTWATVNVIITVEKRGLVESFRESLERMRGFRVSFFGAAFVFGIIGFVAESIVAATETIVWDAMLPPDSAPPVLEELA